MSALDEGDIALLKTYVSVENGIICCCFDTVDMSIRSLIAKIFTVIDIPLMLCDRTWLMFVMTVVNSS